MKKLLLMAGIACIVICIACLLLAVLNLLAHGQLMDATAEHYQRLHQRAVAGFVSGAVLAAAGAACFFIRTKV